jgi:hypothetical protein
MAKEPTADDLAAARKVLDNWSNRTVEDRDAVLEADRVLSEAWAIRKAREGKRRPLW